MAYEYSKILGAESAESDKYLPMLPQFADMLEDKIDVSKYKDSMSPLIEKDISELMKVLG